MANIECFRARSTRCIDFYGQGRLHNKGVLSIVHCTNILLQFPCSVPSIPGSLELRFVSGLVTSVAETLHNHHVYLQMDSKNRVGVSTITSTHSYFWWGTCCSSQLSYVMRPSLVSLTIPFFNQCWSKWLTFSAKYGWYTYQPNLALKGPVE